jgi:Rab9 effector protein with kelch motifs
VQIPFIEEARLNYHLRVSCTVTMNWEFRKVHGNPPSGRGYHTAILYDSRLFLFGGYDGHTVFDEVYILDLSTCAYLPQIVDFEIEC